MVDAKKLTVTEDTWLLAFIAKVNFSLQAKKSSSFLRAFLLSIVYLLMVSMYIILSKYVLAYLLFMLNCSLIISANKDF